jgi:hypothetical protein
LQDERKRWDDRVTADPMSKRDKNRSSVNTHLEKPMINQERKGKHQNPMRNLSVVVMGKEDVSITEAKS